MLGVTSIGLNLLMGTGVPVPPPAFVMEALDSAEIAISDQEPSGFSLVFNLGKGGVAGEVPMLTHPAMQAGARVVITGMLGPRLNVLMDGIIENADSKPGEGDQGGTLTLMGRDLTALFARDEVIEEYPGMAAGDIATQVIARVDRPEAEAALRAALSRGQAHAGPCPGEDDARAPAPSVAPATQGPSSADE